MKYSRHSDQSLPTASLCASCLPFGCTRFLEYEKFTEFVVEHIPVGFVLGVRTFQYLMCPIARLKRPTIGADRALNASQVRFHSVFTVLTSDAGYVLRGKLRMKKSGFLLVIRSY